MIARQKPLTPREKQESEPKHHVPHNRKPAEVEAEAKRLIREGKLQLLQIGRKLGVGKSLMGRYASELRGKLPVDMFKVHTKCSGLENCRCVKCEADRLKTPERIRLMHQTDEQERLESHLDALERRGLRSVVDPTSRPAK